MNALRAIMTKILKLEPMVCGEQGGTVGEAIHACNRRLDNHRATMDDFHARISIQDWYHDLSDQEDDEEARQSTTRAEIPMPMLKTNLEWKIDHLEGEGSSETTTLTPEMIQQGMQRVFVAYNQCVTRVAQIDDRLEQFRSAVRRDALEITLNVQRNSQDLQHQGQSVEQER